MADPKAGTWKGDRRRFGDRLANFSPFLLVSGLLVLYALVNWLWLAENVTFSGADKAEHLARSLRYHQILSPLSLRGLFTTMVDHAVRPSLYHISATLAYWLLGFSIDSGPMINLLYLAILLSATYGLGVRLADRKVGLLATALVGVYPMIGAMSRYFYMEFSLVAMVAATLYFLVASDGFESRMKSVLFGLCLGVGLLTKRTYVVFVLVPILYVLLRSKLLPALWRRFKGRPHVHWRALLVATAGSALLASLWFFPNRGAAADLVLGDWLFPIWWFLAALSIYLLALPSAPEINLLVSMSLGASVASAWYLARIEFILRAVGFAYGYQRASDRSFAWLEPSTYYYYLRRIVVEHISPFHAAFTLLAVCILLYLWFRSRPKLATVWWVLVCWVAGGYALMTFTLYRQSRAILPVLPAIALLTAAGLLRIRWRHLRLALVSLMMIGGFLQLAVLSFTPLRPVAETVTWGTTSLFAQGGNIQWPDYGPTDPGWAIHDDLLGRLEAVRQSEDLDVVRLGLLANTSHLNGPQFQPLRLTSYPQVVVESLTRSSKRGESAFQLLFDYDYLALKRENRAILEEEQATIERLLSEPPPVFTQVFELDTSYPLPDGDQLYLYGRRDFAPKDLEAIYLSDLVAYLAANGRSGDAILLDTPGMLAAIARELGETPAYHVGPLTGDELASIAPQYERILVVDWAPVGSDHGWLDRHAHRSGDQWFGDVQLITYAPPGDLAERASGALFGQAFSLERYAVPDGPLSPGDVLALRLAWRATGTPDGHFKIFAHLLATDGRLVAQYDGEPVGGTRPTTAWALGEEIDDLRGIVIPMDLAAGTYTLVVGWYPADGGDRLPVLGADGESLGTQLELGSFQVVPR